MSIAAVPNYLSKHDHAQASPGLRFGMLLPIWSQDFNNKEKDSEKSWEFICKLNDNDLRLMNALSTRQAACLHDAVVGDHTTTFEAISIAPFTTGLGNEHPLENGFTFLNPYGLPYLPGSGVKGVLRQAAWELADGQWGDTHGWTEDAITILFGPKDTDNARRGALMFHDVIPQIRGNKLMVEIMTPHQKHYYQDGEPPHDSGSPVPIKFLTIPPDTGFCFQVGCNRALLQHEDINLASNAAWKTLLEAAFEHAFNWLGFGAKTAVGYGAMRRLSEQEVQQANAAAAADAMRCDWVDTTLQQIAEQNNSKPDEALRGKALAEAWAKLEDADIKQRALADIQQRWQAQGWWDTPPGKAAKRALSVYREQE